MDANSLCYKALTLKSDAKLDCRKKRKVKMASNTV